MKLICSSITCADDCHVPHLPKEFWDQGVVSGVQSIAVDSQVELQPAGVGVVGHLVFRHGDVGQSSRLAVQLHVSNKWNEAMLQCLLRNSEIHVRLSKDAFIFFIFFPEGFRSFIIGFFNFFLKPFPAAKIEAAGAGGANWNTT